MVTMGILPYQGKIPMVEPGIFFLIVLYSFVYFLFNCPYCPIILRAVDFSILKNPTASVGSEPLGIEPGTSSLVVRNADHQTTRLVGQSIFDWLNEYQLRKKGSAS
jgi:hypothetical protein